MEGMVRTDDLRGTLRVGSRAWHQVDGMECRVTVTALGEVDGTPVAIVSIPAAPDGPYDGGCVDVCFAGDLLPESWSQSQARFRAHPETIGLWPAFIITR